MAFAWDQNAKFWARVPITGKCIKHSVPKQGTFVFDAMLLRCKAVALSTCIHVTIVIVDASPKFDRYYP